MLQHHLYGRSWSQNMTKNVSLSQVRILPANKNKQCIYNPPGTVPMLSLSAIFSSHVESIGSQTNLSSKAVLNLLRYSPSGEVAGVGVSIETTVTLGRPRGEGGVVLGPPLVEAMKKSAHAYQYRLNINLLRHFGYKYLITMVTGLCVSNQEC